MIDPGDNEEIVVDTEEVEEWIEEHYGDMADECCDGS